MIVKNPQVFGVTYFFKCFYNGFSEESTIWFAYFDDNHDFKNPVKFELDYLKNDEYAINSLIEAITQESCLPTSLRDGANTASNSIIHQ